LKYKGERFPEDGRLWDEVILKDFGELQKAGLKHPLMDEVRAAFSFAQTNK